ncbi:hypothetical protein [Gemmata sp.]|uniref:hypothetical protein n=1 Tax=Gemmata sp. TaxID=1914242 RepID=UPI003F71E937
MHYPNPAHARGDTDTEYVKWGTDPGAPAGATPRRGLDRGGRSRVRCRVAGGRRGPCPHAAFVSVGVTGSDPAGRPDDALTWLWLWTRGRGLERMPRLTRLAEAVDLVACGIPVEGGPPLDAEYRAAGMAAEERDHDAPGSGTVTLVAPGRGAARRARAVRARPGRPG